MINYMVDKRFENSMKITEHIDKHTRNIYTQSLNNVLGSVSLP